MRNILYYTIEAFVASCIEDELQWRSAIYQNHIDHRLLRLVL